MTSAGESSFKKGEDEDALGFIDPTFRFNRATKRFVTPPDAVIPASQMSSSRLGRKISLTTMSDTSFNNGRKTNLSESLFNLSNLSMSFTKNTSKNRPISRDDDPDMLGDKENDTHVNKLQHQNKSKFNDSKQSSNMMSSKSQSIKNIDGSSSNSQARSTNSVTPLQPPVRPPRVFNLQNNDNRLAGSPKTSPQGADKNLRFTNISVISSASNSSHASELEHVKRITKPFTGVMKKLGSFTTNSFTKLTRTRNDPISVRKTNYSKTIKGYPGSVVDLDSEGMMAGTEMLFSNNPGYNTSSSSNMRTGKPPTNSSKNAAELLEAPVNVRKGAAGKTKNKRKRAAPVSTFESSSINGTASVFGEQSVVSLPTPVTVSVKTRTPETRDLKQEFEPYKTMRSLSKALENVEKASNSSMHFRRTSAAPTTRNTRFGTRLFSNMEEMAQAVEDRQNEEGFEERVELLTAFLEKGDRAVDVTDKKVLARDLLSSYSLPALVSQLKTKYNTYPPEWRQFDTEKHEEITRRVSRNFTANLRQSDHFLFVIKPKKNEVDVDNELPDELL